MSYYLLVTLALSRVNHCNQQAIAPQSSFRLGDISVRKLMRPIIDALLYMSK